MICFRFGAFELNQDGTLWCHGSLVPLSPMQRQLLLSFCRRPRQVIAKAELMQDVWGHDGVSEVSLARTVHGLRRRLASAITCGELIRNVYGEGYLLTVPVERVSADDASTPAEPVSAARVGVVSGAPRGRVASGG